MHPHHNKQKNLYSEEQRERERERDKSKPREREHRDRPRIRAKIDTHVGGLRRDIIDQPNTFVTTQ